MSEGMPEVWTMHKRTRPEVTWSCTHQNTVHHEDAYAQLHTAIGGETPLAQRHAHHADEAVILGFATNEALPAADGPDECLARCDDDSRGGPEGTNAPCLVGKCVDMFCRGMRWTSRGRAAK